MKKDSVRVAFLFLVLGALLPVMSRAIPMPCYLCDCRTPCTILCEDDDGYVHCDDTGFCFGGYACVPQSELSTPSSLAVDLSTFLKSLRPVDGKTASAF